MDLRALTAAAVRFFALYTLLSCIDTAGEIAATIALPKELSGGSLPYFLAVQLVVLLLASWFLLARTRVVTGWVLQGEASSDEQVSFTSRDLTLAAFSLAGLIFLVSGLETIFTQVLDVYLAPHRLPIGPVGVQLSRMAGSIIKVAAGILLLVGSRRRQAREA